MGRKSTWLALVSLEILTWSLAPQGAWAQTVAPVEKSAAIQPTTEKYRLRWKFEPGEVIKVEQKLQTKYETLNQEMLQEYKYCWIVREVDESGLAKLSLVFQDVNVTEGEKEKAFRAASERNTDDFNKPERRSPLIYEARTLFNSEVELVVTPNGGTGVVNGAASLPNIRMFTPGDLPALPENSVAIGESWRFPVAIDAVSGEATCTISSVEEVKGHRIAKIECNVLWGQMSKQYQQVAQVKIEPSKIISRFDIDSGKFIEEENGMKMRLMEPQGRGTPKSQPEKIVESISIDQERHLAELSTTPYAKSMSGEYMFAFANGQFMTLVSAGLKMRKQSDPQITTSEMLTINFFHDWEDSDGDKSLAEWELKEVNRRFTTDEDVRFLITAVGMEKRKMRFDLLNAFGEELHSGAIPIKAGPGYLAVREMRLPEGIYFFEFFIDGKFEVRVPVHVIAGK